MINFTLPNIPYEGFEPCISPETMKVHHSKHHQTYINNFKTLVETHKVNIQLSWKDFFQSLDQYSTIQQGLKNQGGGHFNHLFFWQCLSSQKTQLSLELKNALEQEFSSLENFQVLMENAGKAHFGSGFVWLFVDEDRKLQITTTPNQDNPYMNAKNIQLILGIDLWEHAYYLTYQSNRAGYLQNFWSICNWDFMSKNFEINKNSSY